MNARITLAGITAVAFLAMGCGQKREGQAVSSVTTTQGPAALASQEQATPTETGTQIEAVPRVESQTQGTVDAAIAESLPPEIDATISEEPVAPGTVIEISAVGSSDVTEMVVQDSRGKTYPMTRIDDTAAWRTYYRLPIKVTDRVALSVTARNGVNQWKRVWVFPKVVREEASADSSGR